MAPTRAELEAQLASTSAEQAPEAHIDALNALAWDLRNDDVPRANRLASEARALAIRCGHKRGQARAARILAMTIHGPEEVKTIFERAHEALELYEEVGDRVGCAGARDFLASLHEFVGDLHGGMEYALSALQIAREVGDPVREGYALSSVGGLLAAMGDVDEAVARLEEALALFEAHGENVGIETIYSRLCKVLKQAGRFDEAMALARRALGVAERAQNEFLNVTALTVMGEVEALRGDTKQAEALYRRALACFEHDFQRDLFGVDTRIALARLLLSRGALQEAERELQSVIEADPDLSVGIVPVTAVHEALAEVYEHQDRPAEALKHLREAKRLREVVLKRDSRSKLAQVETRAALEAAKRDAEIHKLRFVELHGMQAKLIEAEKMALLGKLAAGTAHELNTPLGVLRSDAQTVARAAERLLSLLPEGDSRGERIAAALASCRVTTQDAITRIGTISESFARFSQLDHAERRAFDVREGLRSALTLLSPTVPAGIEIIQDYHDVPAVSVWPRELNHAFLTVLQNAVQSIAGEGTVRLAVRHATGEIQVDISDTGRGMSQPEVDALFDVGFSADGDRTRMRLGLPAAQATLRKLGGRIEVTSVPGEGTRVRFAIPTAGTGGDAAPSA